MKSQNGFKPIFSKWRHGGWYVLNVCYPNNAIGCVSNNYPDKKWRIVCDERRKEIGDETDITFSTRNDAAFAEFNLANSLKLSAFLDSCQK